MGKKIKPRKWNRKLRHGPSGPGHDPDEYGIDIQTSMILPPTLETEEDCLRYLQEDLPDWIDAMSAIFKPANVASVEATLFWDLREMVRAIGQTLETGIAPLVDDDIDDECRVALISWAAGMLDGDGHAPDARLLLKAARRGLRPQCDEDEEAA